MDSTPVPDRRAARPLHGVAGRHPHLQQRPPPGWPAGSAFAEQAAAQLHDIAQTQLPVAVLVQHAGQ